MLSRPLIRFILIAVIGVACGIGGYLFYRSSNKENTLNAFKGGEKEIGWELLKSISPKDFENNSFTSDMQSINNSLVKVPGFIIPLEDSQNFVSEFLLVPTPMACIHVPPPPPNQIIYVVMASGRKAKMSYGPVWVRGRLMIEKKSGSFGAALFAMTGESTEPYQ